MFEVNLVPEVKMKLLRAQKMRNVVIFFSVIIALSAVGAVVVAFIILGTTNGISAVSARSIRNEFDTLSSRPSVVETLTIQNQMNNIDILSDSKQVPSRFFAFLDASLPEDDSPHYVTLSDVTYDVSTNTMTLEGQSRGGYAALDAFMKTIALVGYRYVPDFDEEMDIDLEGEALEERLSPSVDEDPIFVLVGEVQALDHAFGRDSDGRLVVRFTLRFELNPEMISFNRKRVVIEGPVRQIVTDSYVQMRDNIFDDRAEACAPDDVECLNQNGGF